MKEKSRIIAVTIEVSPDSGWVRFRSDYKGGGAPFVLAMFDFILSEWEKAVPSAGRDVEKSRRMRMSVCANEVDATMFIARMSSKELKNFQKYLLAGSDRFIRLEPKSGDWKELTAEEYRREAGELRRKAIRSQEEKHVQRHREAQANSGSKR
ncbi:MAG: hypothetical protein HGB18_00750 [Candidatus Moranbacteria bacterium]|nr:hypothetical protein [Candidatus Moranbacteria bacterium]